MSDGPFCERCWPDREEASYRGVYGYRALCTDCYLDLAPQAQADRLRQRNR